MHLVWADLAHHAESYAIAPSGDGEAIMVRRLVWVILGFLLVAGLGTGVRAITDLANSVAIELEGIKTTGRVVWTSAPDGDPGTFTNVEIVTVDGQRFIVGMFCFPFPCFFGSLALEDRVGMTVPVAYPRTNPARAMADTFSGRWLSPVSLLLGGAFVALLGVAGIRELWLPKSPR
jgi:hypothetical protein